jgi:hypothetical protein
MSEKVNLPGLASGGVSGVPGSEKGSRQPMATHPASGEDGDGSYLDGDSSEEEDEEGWITPENFADACAEMGGTEQEPAAGIAVGCITTDFAMQVWKVCS